MTELDLDERIADIFTVAPEYRVNHIKQLIRDVLEYVKPPRGYTITGITADGGTMPLGTTEFDAANDYVEAKIKELLG